MDSKQDHGAFSELTLNVLDTQGRSSGASAAGDCCSMSGLSCLPSILLHTFVFKPCNQVSYSAVAERVSAPEEAPTVPLRERGLKKSWDVFGFDFSIATVKQGSTADSEVNKHLEVKKTSKMEIKLILGEKEKFHLHRCLFFSAPFFPPLQFIMSYLT